MLADAFAAERLRLSRAWGTLFWAFLFVPIVSIAMGVVQSLFMKMALRKAGAATAGLGREPVDLAHQVVQSFGITDFFLVQLFFMIGAAAVLAGDYRWETWRLLTPRNTRANLMLGKLATFGVAAAGGLLAIGVAAFVSALLDAAILGSPVTFTRDAGALPAQFAGSFIASWLELMVLAAVAACVAVITRNGLGAILTPVALWIVQSLVISRVRMEFPVPSDPPLAYLAALPALCTDVMRTAILGGGPGFVKPENTPFALIFLLLWLVALTVLAVWLFRRQDLTRE